MEELEVLIERYPSGEKQTIGHLYVLNEHKETVYDCHTLELPWKENKKRISCIPKGVNTVVKRWSKKYKWHFHITDVEGRSWILIHIGNFYTEILGCILIGTELEEINGDGIMDVKHSGTAMKELLEILPDKFTLTIV